MSTSTPTPHVLILGAGFAGLYAAKALGRAPVRVTVLDRRNHHLFQPLLYQVATAGLNPADIAAPIRSILRKQDNTAVVLAEAVSVDVAARRVALTDGETTYDYLIVATGATHSYFGNDAWAPHAPGLKSLEDALEIRRRVFLAYENAEREADPSRHREWLTFVIIGAGPTGVEMAGALAEISRQALSNREFRNVDPRSARIILVEGTPRVLPPYPPELSARAKQQLERLGVEVWTGAQVTAIDERGVSLGEERLAARTIVWAAGVQASPLVRSLEAPLDRVGRVKVTPQLTVPGHDEIFVVGDLVALEQDGSPVPGVCPSAIQEGRHAARNIVHALRAEPLEAFRYHDKGSFATIGRGAAVGMVASGLQMWGFIAWVAWMAIHIFFLIGFRNRALVMFQWAYSYATFRRGARLITGGGVR
jgi:NADH dehydrogenase